MVMLRRQDPRCMPKMPCDLRSSTKGVLMWVVAHPSGHASGLEHLDVGNQQPGNCCTVIRTESRYRTFAGAFQANIREMCIL